MFQLTKEEVDDSYLKSQFVTSKNTYITERYMQNNSSRSQIVTLNEGISRGQNIKYLPFAFTENGIAMLSSVLRSKTAIQMNISIMRAFNEIYAPIDVIEMKKSHDRFLIIDDDLYHFGTSIKDLGKKIFAFDKFIESPDSLLARL